MMQPEVSQHELNIDENLDDFLDEQAALKSSSSSSSIFEPEDAFDFLEGSFDDADLDLNCLVSCYGLT